MSGTLDSFGLDRLSDLLVVWGSSNSFTGTIPSELGALTKLRKWSVFYRDVAKLKVSTLAPQSRTISVQEKFSRRQLTL